MTFNHQRRDFDFCKREALRMNQTRGYMKAVKSTLTDEQWQEEHSDCPGHGKFSTWYCWTNNGRCTESNCPFVYWEKRREGKDDNPSPYESHDGGV